VAEGSPGLFRNPEISKFTREILCVLLLTSVAGALKAKMQANQANLTFLLSRISNQEGLKTQLWIKAPIMDSFFLLSDDSEIFWAGFAPP
jgi:hypothetical protein